jgi:asparagine synthase (glutamine-hydrolysing)
MCGFVGCFQSSLNKPVCIEKVRRLLDVIKYRGPDDTGVFEDKWIGFGHVRLSILDLSKLGAQPMISQCGRYVIAYNGEIYNFATLRDELKANGVVLKSTGDTEALLEFIALFGVARCLEIVEGMFAFALWDREEKTIVLARDRHGIKPLYYAKNGDGEIWFASEMKALLEYSSGPDYTTVNAAMLGLGCAYDSHTLLRGISSVRAGEYIVFKKNSAPLSSFFFRLPDFVDENAYSEMERLTPIQIVDRIHEALRESMRLCMISDAPLAVLASGGVDSSLIAAMASKAHPDLKLFHANVVGASETEAAEALAKHLNCELFAQKVTEQETLNHTPIVTYHYEMPLMYHTNAVPFYLVSRLASREGIKVVLTGEGSDEYFIGYADMAIWPEIQIYRKIMRRLQELMHRVPRLGGILWPKVSESVAEQLRSTIFRFELDERRTEAESAYGFVTSWRKRLLSYMSLDMCEGNIPPLLHRNDRLGMAWGIESRFPFLGHALAGAALNLPAQFKVRKTWKFADGRHPFIVDKWCVRQVAESYLPRELAHRGKYAFRGTVYGKLLISKNFFDGGFVQDFYGLGDRPLELMVGKSSNGWRSRLFLLEVWGQIFAHRQDPNLVQERINKFVSYN